MHFLAGVSSFDMPTCYQEMISYQQCKAACSISNCTATIKPVFTKSSVLDAGQPIWYRTEKIAKLPPSADGWRVVAWNNGTSDVEFRIILQLFTLPVDCSDAKDGATQFGENLHSVNLGNKHVRSLSSNDQCLKVPISCVYMHFFEMRKAVLPMFGAHICLYVSLTQPFSHFTFSSHRMGAHTATARIIRVDSSICALYAADRVSPRVAADRVATVSPRTKIWRALDTLAIYRKKW